MEYNALGSKLFNSHIFSKVTDTAIFNFQFVSLLSKYLSIFIEIRIKKQPKSKSLTS